MGAYSGKSQINLYREGVRDKTTDNTKNQQYFSDPTLLKIH